MRVLIAFLIALTIFLNRFSFARAADKLVFDSTDHYLGACQLTNKSEWKLEADLNVTTFEVWYSWNANESTLPVKVFLNGDKFAEFEATRSSCDPYQKQWCNADYKINKVFPKGTYTTEIPERRQCLKPGGTGAIRLYSDNTPTATASPTLTPTPEITRIVTVTPTPIIMPQTCSCNQTSIVVTAAAVSAITSAVIALFLKFILK